MLLFPEAGIKSALKIAQFHRAPSAEAKFILLSGLLYLAG
jgi:hypothetical protein